MVRQVWFRQFVFGLTVAVAATGLILSGQAALEWMETADFCGRCHTMAPELAAYARSPHRSVECGACHIGREPADLVQAKLNGTVQLFRLITNTYQRPIPPAGHQMTKGAAQCQTCHENTQKTQDRLVLRRSYREDEQNTLQLVAFVLKASAQHVGRERGVHWHVQSVVEFAPHDDLERQVDYIRVTDPSGVVREYVSEDLRQQWASSQDLLAPVKAAGHLERMDCLACHNRVGHEFLSPGQALDMALRTNQIDRDLPAIKRRGVELLAGRYESTEAAQAAISTLTDYYQQTYPAVYEQRRPAIETAITVLQRLYTQVARPEMRASHQTYPSYLGHRDAAGCFRCHDGNHFLLADGRPTTTIIPFNCSLCHTFPQQGEAIQTVMVTEPPVSHSARLWFAEHGRQAGSLDSTRTTCGACHAQSSCRNCHSTGLAHRDMLFNHAAILREQGGGVCAACHQRPFCLRCHSSVELPTAP